MKQETVLNTHFDRFPWSSVLAGVIGAVAVQILLSALGTAIGLATLSPFSGGGEASHASFFGIYWWIVTGLISIAIGAFLAAILSNAKTDHEGEVVGFITWALLNVLAALFIFVAAGGVVKGSSKVVGAASGAVTENTAEAKIVPQAPGNQGARNTVDSERAAERASAGAAVTFVSLLLGLITAIYAGKLGSYYRDPEVAIVLFGPVLKRREV